MESANWPDVFRDAWRCSFDFCTGFAETAISESVCYKLFSGYNRRNSLFGSVSSWKDQQFADYLLGKVPDKVLNKVANTYNKTLKKLGDKKPDFVSAVKDLTHSFCKDFNNKIKKSDKVYYQSVGSKLNTYRGGRFPLNLSNNFVKYFDGANDGLVGEDSFKYGDKYTFIQHEGKRGISHGDMIDLNRENIDGFDVREFFVKLVSELREKGF